ncbi:ATP-dependent DNA helicase RecG [Chloroflexus sp.]|uniref:ATP-dependent DNA helicase RecG n=1 Tax=Chloroflexus sp. TaxID=1904827 RepID=UPI002ACD6750|nr:ATP-dependent DNA helicase RecG [Chloroflexus sp.]
MTEIERQQVTALGKVLAAERRDGCADRVTDDGLLAFLRHWSAAAGSAARLPAVQRAIGQLMGYDGMTLAERDQALAAAIEELRSLFRLAPNPPEPAPVPEPAPPASRRTVTRQVRNRAVQMPKRPLAELDLDAKLEQITEVDLRLAGSFRRLGVVTIRDLLYHFPRRYDDVSRRRSINELQLGAEETVIGEVTDVRTIGAGPKLRVRVEVSDETGSIEAIFFNQRWIAQQIKVGQTIALSGKVTAFGGKRQFSSPRWERYTPDPDALLHTGRLVPIYPLTQGLHENQARRFIKHVIDAMAPRVPDHLPPHRREQARLLPLGEALAQIHFPDSHETLAAARRRLGFDEFLFIQLGVLQRKRLWQQEIGLPFTIDMQVHADLQRRLPFQFTAAQQRAIGEIFADLQRPSPMARLLQGDVGSGKTVVAAAALLQAVANGFQGALMAPTEILAEQHAKNLKQLLSRVRVPRKATATTPAETYQQADWRALLDPDDAAKLAEIVAILGMTPEEDMAGQGVRVALLTGSLGVRERRRVLEGIARGEIDLVIGTHALITETVQFANLGLVVVDEQHRFGVEQRLRLKNKGCNPHMLVMTATPIPRTLTLTIYGDLDVSVLDERPPGRQEIRTRRISRSEREKAYRHIRKQVAEGRQVYVICPLVEESEKLDLPSAEEMYERLQHEVFPDLRVALLHGKMPAREKDEVMRAFRDHQYDILVATAVIEVGIDVPNATTIVIEGAERFGLAQLHQFRGRVGRGSHQSYCILISDSDNQQSKERLAALEQTNDGFKLAEIDLQLRGPGEFFGTRQSGTPDLKMAQQGDTRLLAEARWLAEAILNDDPELAHPEHHLLRQNVDAFWAEALQAG